MGKKITQLATITEVADDDLLIGVDISDTSGSDDGTNKKFTKASLLSNLEHGAEVDNPSSGVHGVTGDIVGTTDTQTLTNKTLTSPLFGGTIDGWISAGETWTYASADDPTFTFTVAADVTTKYSAGMKIKLTQGTVKYFIITAVSTYSGGKTTITVYGGTDYDLANSAISANAYSMMRTPAGFPMSPAKWTQTITSTTGVSAQASPTSGAVYNVGGSLVVPIGLWELRYDICAYFDMATAGYIGGAVSWSTANNSHSLTESSTFIFANNSILIRQTQGSAIVATTSKTTYYVNISASYSGMSTIQTWNYGCRRYATCAYL